MDEENFEGTYCNGGEETLSKLLREKGVYTLKHPFPQEKVRQKSLSVTYARSQVTTSDCPLALD